MAPIATPHVASPAYSPAGLNGRVTQAEVDALEAGLDQTLAALEDNLVQEVFGETLPLVGKNFRVAWSNQVPAFRYLTTLRTAVVAGLGSLTGSADYAPSTVASAINTRLTSAGFNAGSAAVATTPNDQAQVAFTTTDTFATNVTITTNFGVPNLDLQLLGATNCRVAVTATFNFTAGVDGSGFYLETASTFSFNTTSTISNLNTAVRFVRLPYTLADVTTNRTSVPLNFAIALKDPGNDGRIRLGELGGSPDLLDATVTGNTRMSFALLSSVPASALLPQVGTDLELLWNFTNAPVNPNDNNAAFGNQPALTLKNNRINLHSFFNSFARRALVEIQEATAPLQPLIDVLTVEIPLLSDLGSDTVTVLDVLGVPPETVAAIGALADLADLANLAGSYTNNQNVFVDRGNYSLQAGDLRVDHLEDITGSLVRPPSASLDPDLVDFKGDAAAITGLSFPLLEDANITAKVLLGRAGTLFTWDSGAIQFEEDFQQYFPVLGPLGVTLGGRVGLKTQFGFGYDTQGIFDYYAGGANDPDLFLNGFYALAADDQGNPVTGITLEAGITAGVELNVLVASAGVEGDVTATIGMYLDDQLGVGDGKVRGYTLFNTPITDWFYAAGSLSAGLRAYLEVGWPPFGYSFEFDSPRVTLISFDTQDDIVPVLANYHPGDGHLILNVGDRASFRLYGDLEDRAEEFFISNSGGGGVTVEAFNEPMDFPLPTLIIGDANLRGDVLTTAADLNVPVNFSGGPARDILTGGAANDELDGGDGPDRLSGRAGNDILRGGSDNDELFGGAGNDTLDGGPGLDKASWVGDSIPVTIDLRTATFSGAAAGDTLVSIERYEGSDWADLIDGSEGKDELLAGAGGNDIINGHGGPDMLDGGGGDDTLNGGTGDDLMIGGSGADALDGGEGVDTVSYLGALSPVTVSLLTGLGTRGDANGDTLTNFEMLVGSGLPKEFGSIFASGDILEGSTNADTIYGMDGADTIRGFGGNDLIYGNHPDQPESLIAGYDADDINGGDGNDVIHGQGDDDKLDGGEGMDTLYGETGNDHLLTFDLLYPDILDGGEGTNRLSADYSDKSEPLVFIVGTNNTFSFPDGDSFTNMQTLGALRTGSSNDLIRLSAGPEYIPYGKNIDAGPGDDLVLADWRGFYGVSPNTFRSSDTLAGGAGNDTLSFEQSIGGVSANLATGGTGGAAAGITFSGFENLIGTPFTDTLNGDAGPNILNPIATAPHAPGGVGINDYADGGGGVDILRMDFSTLAEANLKGVAMGANTGTGYESISLGSANSPFNVDVMVYHLSIERFEIIGGQTNDHLYGESVSFGATNYNDTFFGLGGNDVISGALGNDYIDGGEGNDSLDAGAGNDTVIGGPGNDSIVFDYQDNLFTAYGTDICDAGPGDDFVRDSNLLGNDASQAIASTTYKFDGGPGFDTLQIDVGHMTMPFVFDENHPPAEILLPNGGYLRNFEHISAVTTGSGNDILVLPGRVNNTIATRTGNDIVNPGMGFDGINGGSGGDDLLILDYSVLDDPDTSGVYYSNSSNAYERNSLSAGTVLDRWYAGGFERMHFIGTSKADNMGGFGGNDQFFGGEGDDGLAGSNGDDWIDGGPGADTMIGGNQNDTYIVDDPGDVVTESVGAGTDTVRASMDYTLPVNVELLVLTGAALNGTGNASSNQITGNGLNNYLRGEGGNDNLNGGGGPHEIDRLNGGANADVFVLGDGATRFYDDGNPTTLGLDGYAVIEDFTPSQSDRLRLSGSATQYRLGASPIGGVPGTALYHDSNTNGVLDAASDELIAILVSPETLTTTNTLANATYTQSADPAVIGLTPLRPATTAAAGELQLRLDFSLFEPMPNGVLLEIQSSSDLGFTDPWLTIASKNGGAAWTGSALAAVGAPDNGSVTVSITDALPILHQTQRFFRAKLTVP